MLDQGLLSLLHTCHGLVSCYRRWMNTFSKMEVHWWTYNHCLFVSHLTSVAFGYRWISDTNFQKFRIRIGYGYLKNLSDMDQELKNQYPLTSGEHGQDQDCISSRILAIFLDQNWVGIFIFEKIGSGYFFDFYNEIYLRVIQDFVNDDGSVFFAMVFILTKIKMIMSVCAALITINDNSCYFIEKFFPARQSGNSKLLLYCWYAVFVCCAVWHNGMHVLCRPIIY